MTKSKVGNNRYLKEFNQTGILDLIRIHKSISRADLSKLTGLSPTAIGGIVSGLLEAGYITEVGIGKSKGGRRPMLLELKPQSFYSIGIDVDTNYLRLVLMDITSKVIDERLVNVPQTLFFEVIIKEIANKTFEIMKDNNIEVKKLLGVGVSIPGMIDSRGGKVILAPNLGWENVDIIEKLTELINLPVFIENEAMASAICEYWVGACQGTKNFVCINIMSGIGSGIFIDGKPYRGAGGTTGEVGHIVVDDSGKKCGCGNYGCLETFSSTNGIIERANHLIKQGVVSKLNDIENIEEINIKTIIDTARS